MRKGTKNCKVVGCYGDGEMKGLNDEICAKES